MSVKKQGRPGGHQTATKNKTTTIDSTASKHSAVPPRSFVLVMALYFRPITRKESDQLTSSSNGPHYIYLLRHRYGLVIPRERISRISEDGYWSCHSRYSATKADKILIQELIEKLGGLADVW